MCFRWLSCRVCVLCAFCVCVCAGDKRVYRQLLAKRHKLVSYWVRHTFSRCLAKKNSSILFFFNFQFNIRKLANITKCIHMKCVYVQVIRTCAAARFEFHHTNINIHFTNKLQFQQIWIMQPASQHSWRKIFARTHRVQRQKLFYA